MVVLPLLTEVSTDHVVERAFVTEARTFQVVLLLLDTNASVPATFHVDVLVDATTARVFHVVERALLV